VFGAASIAGGLTDTAGQLIVAAASWVSAPR